jgi:glycosyltransferase involved in cell wall biosynthesis
MKPLAPVTMTLTRSSSVPKLSICILTYNRSRYLRKCLTHLFETQHFDFDFEVLISDNASTDDTPELVAEFMDRYKQIRYIRQTRNVGSEANMVAAYRQAIGDYTTYLADDDLVLPDQLAQVVKYLDAHPGVAVCYTPWELWNDVHKVRLAVFYHLDAEARFSKTTAGDLCNFIIGSHVFPEIFVYRSEALRSIMYRQHKIYWAFANMINVLNYGDVVFLPTIFYRSVTEHWAGEQREQEGNKQVLSEWDLYRGGLEYMIYRAFTYGGAASIPVDQRANVLQMVQAFINLRMQTALRLLIGKRQFMDAFDVFARLVANGALTDAEVAAQRTDLMVRAAAAAFLETFRSITRARCIGLYCNDNQQAIRQLLIELDASLPIESLDQIDPGGVTDKEAYLVLTGDQSKRDILVDAGFPPGQVWAEDDLLRQFAM